MQTMYQRDLKNHYLVLRGTQNRTESDYQVRMICDNTLTGFAGCHTESIDNELRYFYQVTSLQSLEEILAIRPAGRTLLKTLFLAILSAVREAESYLLPQDGILLQPSLIFYDLYQNQFYFCYYPEPDVRLSEMLKELSEYLLPHLDQEDRTAVMLGFSFYQACASGELTEEKLRILLETAGEESSISTTDTPRAPQRSPEDLERERILDEFFSDNETYEESLRTARQKTWILYAAVCMLSLGTAALFALRGLVRTGLGTAILINAAFFMLMRKKDSIRQAFLDIRTLYKLHRDSDPADLTQTAGIDWRTYEERAAELEESPEPSAGSGWMKRPGTPAGSGWMKRSGTPAGEPADPSPVRNIPEAPDIRDSHSTHDTHSTHNTHDTHSTHNTHDIHGTHNTYDAYEETVWLGTDPASGSEYKAMLISSSPALPPVPLCRKEHFLGKSGSAADLVLPSAAVSRLHARLILREGTYYLSDLRSRNGTTLNGTPLTAGSEYPLSDGDLIRFADLTYHFSRSRTVPSPRSGTVPSPSSCNYSPT